MRNVEVYNRAEREQQTTGLKVRTLGLEGEGPHGDLA